MISHDVENITSIVVCRTDRTLKLATIMYSTLSVVGYISTPLFVLCLASFEFYFSGICKAHACKWHSERVRTFVCVNVCSGKILRLLKHKLTVPRNFTSAYRDNASSVSLQHVFNLDLYERWGGGVKRYRPTEREWEEWAKKGSRERKGISYRNENAGSVRVSSSVFYVQVHSSCQA